MEEEAETLEGRRTIHREISEGQIFGSNVFALPDRWNTWEKKIIPGKNSFWERTSIYIFLGS